MVNVIVATTPLEMTFSFNPYSAQVEVPGTVLLHITDLLAVLAVPATATTTPEKSVVG